MGDVVKPEPFRLTLSGHGRFIIIKKRLNQGETEDMYERMSPMVTPGSPSQLKRREVRQAKVLAYLIGWSLTDGDQPGEGLPLPMSPDMPDQERADRLRALDPDTFSEIFSAITAHEEAMEEARAAQKKILRGELASSETSPLPSGLTATTSALPN